MPVMTLESETAGLCVAADNITNFGMQVYDPYNMTVCGLLRPHGQVNDVGLGVIFLYSVNRKHIAAGESGNVGFIICFVCEYVMWVKCISESEYFILSLFV